MERLKAWFTASKRDLPWRDEPTPYAVWVSEVMLQQTQVAVVIPYFLNWMERFPTIRDLASASLEEVIKVWEGLGYYSRARNLHEAARFIVEEFEGVLPQTEEELSKIKGIGPYTTGAILSFAYHKKAAAVDGNVMRVITRFLGMREDISKAKTSVLIREKILAMLPEKESWVVNEALIELGATVCQKKAKCKECPLKKDCVAYKLDLVDDLPFKSAKIQYEKVERTVAVMVCGDALLVRNGQVGEVREFPYFDSVKELKEQLQIESEGEPLEKVSHAFTRYRITLWPFVSKVKKEKKVKGCEWVTLKEIERLTFSSGHRRVLQQVLSTCNTPCGNYKAK